MTRQNRGEGAAFAYAGGVRSRWWTWPVADLAAAVLLAAVMVAAIVASRDQPARSVDTVVVLAVVAIGVWVVIARRAPRTALVGACVSFFAALAVGVAAFSPALALGFPLFAVAVAGHLWWGFGLVGLIGSSSMSYRLLGEGPSRLRRWRWAPCSMSRC
jgi:hypothetical protein